MVIVGIIKKMLVWFLVIFACWLLGYIWFTAQIPSKQAELGENAADAIVALTGDGGRLEYSLQLLAENKAGHLFISGVGEKVSVSDILHLFPDGFGEKSDAEIATKIATKISLGHDAKNTIGNAEEAEKWLRGKDYKKIILVTSDYHMPRALLEFSQKMPKITFIPAPTISDGIVAEGKDLPFVEYNKYLAAKLRHLLVLALKKDKK